jgi:hypothetical protein
MAIHNLRFICLSSSFFDRIDPLVAAANSIASDLLPAHV